ncbi:19377_t:CDS:2 [Gigaspora rosea]|nr:19377_t:CDS:2 [Gigaspora rosea]
MIRESLKNGFVTYFQSTSVESSISTKIMEKTSYQISPSNVITKLGFVSAIHNLVKTLPIENVVQASLAYWFEGSYSPKQRKLKMKDKDGYIFGGFAYEDWKQNPKFYGDRKNFLFFIRPKLRCYPTTSYNNNFQYLNFGLKTLPNG